MMFQDAKMFKAFSNRSFSLIGLPSKKKPRYLYLLDVIRQYYPIEVQKVIYSINKIDENLIEAITNSISDEVMSITHKKWVKMLLLHRKEWLVSWYKGGV